MPVKYFISPELDFIVYVCTESITAIEFFNTAEKAGMDPLYKNGMKIIIDFFSADLETNLSDLRLAIAENMKSIQRGRPLGQTAVVTRSSGLKFLGEALQLMSDSLPTIKIFNTRIDAVRWLGLPEFEGVAFWSRALNQIPGVILEE